MAHPDVPGAAPTHCPYCALQCAQSLLPRVAGSGSGPGVEERGRDFPTNRGGLCQKGGTAAELLDHPSRLTAPLVRYDGGLRPAGGA